MRRQRSDQEAPKDLDPIYNTFHQTPGQYIMQDTATPYVTAILFSLLPENATEYHEKTEFFYNAAINSSRTKIRKIAVTLFS